MHYLGGPEGQVCYKSRDTLFYMPLTTSTVRISSGFRHPLRVGVKNC